MVISMLKIRRPLGRLIFNMGIVIPGKTVFLIETAPSLSYWKGNPMWISYIIISTIYLVYADYNNYTSNMSKAIV